MGAAMPNGDGDISARRAKRKSFFMAAHRTLSLYLEAIGRVVQNCSRSNLVPDIPCWVLDACSIATVS